MSSDLEKIALEVREHVIRMSGKGGCFLGASLSCVELIVYLYKRFLSIDPSRFQDETRDYLLLSKGHDVPALYGTFVALGWMPKERLVNHLNSNDSIYWHPNRSIPGVEFHSGSLGHLLSVGAGIAKDIKMKKQNNRVVIITGDGELDEGSNWEAMLVAASLKLDNLVIVVDRNQFQANKRTEELIPLEPLDKKFEAFGFKTRVVDGHSFSDLERGFRSLEFNGAPQTIIAKTQRGRGLPSIAERADRWFCNFTDAEVSSLIDELHGRSQTGLTSETIVAR